MGCSGLRYVGNWPRDCGRPVKGQHDGRDYCAPHLAGFKRREANEAKRHAQYVAETEAARVRQAETAALKDRLSKAEAILREKWSAEADAVAEAIRRIR